LPQEGILIRKWDGYVYLKVDDRYIHALFPLLGLQTKGFREPSYFRSWNSPGAHISVFDADEHVVPKELGQLFHFKLKKIKIVKLKSQTDYAILEVEAPELERLRTQYGLRPKLFGHDFHISIAKKRKQGG
jgi:hypothetical protein